MGLGAQGGAGFSDRRPAPVAYQKAAIREMTRAMLPVTPMKPQGDKRARLQVLAPCD